MTIVFHNKNPEPLLLCPLKFEALARDDITCEVCFNIKQSYRNYYYSYFDKYIRPIMHMRCIIVHCIITVARIIIDTVIPSLA